MQIKFLVRLLSFSLGIALLTAALFFETGSAGPTALQSALTPTPDRLAQPTLPAIPSQADHGAQVFWLSCLPCHGDRGQGLTDEFRQTYPPEEQNCWQSGCHGDRPYEHGFTLPKAVPALIGPGTLQKFPDAVTLHAYIASAMPFWKPGSLTEEESWSVTAYILRSNGLWDGKTDLGASNAAQVPVGPPAPTPATSEPVSAPASQSLVLPLSIGAAIAAMLVLAFFILRARRRNTQE